MPTRVIVYLAWVGPPQVPEEDHPDLDLNGTGELAATLPGTARKLLRSLQASDVVPRARLCTASFWLSSKNVEDAKKAGMLG